MDKVNIKIKELLNNIFGEKYGSLIINEFTKKNNFSNIKYPVDFDFHLIIKKILKSIYADTKFFDDYLNKVPDNKAPDNKVPDNKVPDNKVPDNKVTDNKVPDNKVTDNKVNEKKV